MQTRMAVIVTERTDLIGWFRPIRFCYECLPGRMTFKKKNEVLNGYFLSKFLDISGFVKFQNV